MRYNEIMNENEYLKVNDRYYVNPQLSVDESEQFLEKLKTAQAEGNARIAQETHNLGTDVPSSMGGLSGSGGVWQQRYQNPQVNSMVADLKATAQAQALNETMSNLLAQKQQQYKEAYRRAYKKANAGGPKTDNPDGEDKLDVTTNGGKKNTLEVNENQNVGAGFLEPFDNGMSHYQDENGNIYTLGEISKDDFGSNQLPSTDSLVKSQRPQHGDTKVVNGTTYMYIVNSQSQNPEGSWFVDLNNTGGNKAYITKSDGSGR